MQFNSIPFLFFFAVMYIIYWNIPYRFRHIFLILAGMLFYAYSSISFLFHFLFIISINYFLYVQLNKKPDKKILSLAVLVNILNLGFFKYFYFFSKVLGDITGLEMFYHAKDHIQIFLPLAISFYSFQMIAAAVDSYRRPDPSYQPFWKYLLFVLFFPVLIAGPIMRMTDFFPNLERKEPEKDMVYRACFLMMSGLIKKALFADPLNTFSAPVFANPSEYNVYSLFGAGLLYTMQLFFDFSGLTDMARSVALFLGFEIPENFFAPYYSLTVREFWSRWHVTLSQWLRDYIYFPLGGSRVSEFRTYINVFLTMVIGGFWHGANYTFVAWGAYLGVVMGMERFLETKYGWTLVPKSKLLKPLKAMLVFFVISVSVLMFRSSSASSMIELFGGIVTNSPSYLRDTLISNGDSWLVESAELIDGKPSFLLNSIRHVDTAFNMFLMFLVFHAIQYWPGILDRFQKHRFIYVIVMGVLTIFLLATLSQGGGGFIYNRF
ncbi:MAG: MBOAT family protein [Leptospiraceae bacterium]|nr:MBOAT family protein [Leptospiraceae bacterium]MCP5498919.1 MBOAT family protein [Leptospiraceae bacterium]